MLIGVGDGTRCVSWKNLQVTWAQFVDLFRETKRTDESFEEYSKMTKEEKMVVKESAGAFVGGEMTSPRRLKGTIKQRHLLTYDIDDTDLSVDELWEKINNLWGDYEVFMYSTHSHTPSSTRVRLILPLTSETKCYEEEYEPLARYIASELDIELFDPVSFRANQLMYFPNTAKDGEYVFRHKKGRAVDIRDYDIILEDPRTWKYRKDEVVKHTSYIGSGGQVKDSREKTGVVGLFCRTYTIQEAIEEFLSDVYEPTGDTQKWTYKKGHTSGGLWISDSNLTCGSFHSTDPIKNYSSLNAFDLVRIHKFGDFRTADEEIWETESYIKMRSLVEEDKKCRIQKVRDIIG